MRKGDKSWGYYLSVEKKCREEQDGKTRDWFSLVTSCTPTVARHGLWESVLEIGARDTGGFKHCLPHVAYVCLCPIWGDEETPFGSLRIRAEDMVFPDGTFDLVVIHNALDHCEDMAEVGNRVSAALRPGGMVFTGHYFNHNPHPWAFDTLDGIAEIFPLLDVVESIPFDTQGRKGYHIVVFQKSEETKHERTTRTILQKTPRR